MLDHEPIPCGYSGYGLSGITFDIPGIDRDCQVYLFWKKNEDSSEIAVNPGDFQEDAVQK